MLPRTLDSLARLSTAGACSAPSFCRIPNNWDLINTQETFYVKKEQKINIRVYGCGYAIHGSQQNNLHSHNRFTLQYIGQPAASCKGPFCKGI